ncbi:hypothetical protein [Coconut foliar decay alphasatellite 5]|uniref:Uncharacterized protein n=1 Tax=Coconut foliar decay alphasatellite 5 TaxID=2161878 RepID=A0A2R4N9B8_9VIRU|nr:hypothetical protein KM709_gp2 [Coconut foliar decay alphasatellite 5]AVX29433.1 hypothetical protein [Coconut foliar decay alphasatellite 5]
MSFRIFYVLIQYVLLRPSTRVEPVGLQPEKLAEHGLAFSTGSSTDPDDGSVIRWFFNGSEDFMLPIMQWIWEVTCSGPLSPFHRMSVSDASSISSRVFKKQVVRVLCKSLEQSPFTSSSSRDSVLESYLFFRTVISVLQVGALSPFKVYRVISQGSLQGLQTLPRTFQVDEALQMSLPSCRSGLVPYYRVGWIKGLDPLHQLGCFFF